MTGRIIKALAGFYYVKLSDGSTYACRAKGIFRKRGVSPLVGDLVEMDITDKKDMEGNVTAILPRKNSLSRPPVANVDQALVVFSIHTPDINHSQLTKFLVIMESKGITPVIVFQKMDLASEEEMQEVREIYKPCGYPICFVSAMEGKGLEEVYATLGEKVTTVAGPSGAGKSSLINALLGRSLLEVSAVSKRTGRGRQTTRHTELVELGEKAFLFDTPGFSQVELFGIEKEGLSALFPEFAAHEENCRFRGCAHRNEPQCAVKAAVEDGLVSGQRYRDYCLLYDELVEQERRRY